MPKRKNKNDDQTNSNKKAKVNEYNQDNGYETDSEGGRATTNEDNEFIKNKKVYKSRLLIGENNYSYAVSLIRKYEQKYPQLSSAIVATEV